MTTTEFSTEFDVLYNNVTSNQAPGLNEYEKSVFLTKAEFQLVKEYFNNRTDGVGGGFDGSEKRQYDFSNLIRVSQLYNVNTFKERITSLEKLDRRSKVYLFPQDYFLAVNEIISDAARQYSVLPISYDEYQRLMLKPYNFPVKRGVWRLITDKKNCNYKKEYIKVSEGDDPEDYRNTETDYTIMSTWADQKRNINLCIYAIPGGAGETYEEKAEKWFAPSQGIVPTLFPDYYDDDASMEAFEWDGINPTIISSCRWDDDSLTYNIFVGVDCPRKGSKIHPKINDDEKIIECLKSYYSSLDYEEDEGKQKVGEHLDGFSLCSAPSKFYNFFTLNTGKTFTTEVIQVPMVEIIGKFTGDINYQLRYIKALKPIILDDLTNYGDDLTIEGITQQTECELPVETHQEILERAVTLAKIAWAGGTVTQAASNQGNS